MYHLHCTKKLLERIKCPITIPSGHSTSHLGSWYATALFWKPQLALLVNEHTLLPILMPLAPASSLAARFPGQLGIVLKAHGIDDAFIAHEQAQMREVQYAKTANRSVLGIMNQFSDQSDYYRHELTDAESLVLLSLKLSETPCTILQKRTIFPDRELKILAARVSIQTNLQTNALH